MVQDLIRYDADKQALNLLDSNLRMKDNYISGQQTLINAQQGTIKDLRQMVTQYEVGETELLGNIDKLKNDLNKKKSHLRFYQTAAFAAVAVAAAFVAAFAAVAVAGFVALIRTPQD